MAAFACERISKGLTSCYICCRPLPHRIPNTLYTEIHEQKACVKNQSDERDKMKNHLKAIVAGVLTLAVVGTASAQVRVGIYAGTPQPYYPPVVEVQPRYFIPDQYYSDDREVYIEPSWQQRREWRERRAWRRAERLRREQWRREHWRQEHRRHEQQRHDRRDWDDRD